MQIKLLTEGGNLTPGPSLSQKLGPVGISMGVVIQKVNDATKEYKGMKVPVEIEINAETKEIHIKVSSPPVSGLLKKELGIETGSGMHKKVNVGNISIEQIISIAKTKMPDMLAKDMKAAVKTIIGTCGSLGILVENKLAKEAEQDIDSGKYDKEIKGEKTQMSEEKKEMLKKFYSELKSKQDAAMKQEQAAAEAAKAAAEATATPAAGTATTTAATPAKEEAKTPEKKEAKKK
ncbi:50S ribosomal protein L11 [Candidatus Pacearchaeota archaeon]|nr:50S ribosomal protein L11 [Candidatus Pacearchaeota archaeon]